VNDVTKTVEGIVDLQLELKCQSNRSKSSSTELLLSIWSSDRTTSKLLKLHGRVVSQVLEEQQTFDLIVKARRPSKLDTIRNLLVDTPNGQKNSLAQVATIDYGTGPNTINRENVSV